MPIPKLTYWIAVTDGAGYRVYSCRRLGGPLKKIAEDASGEALKRTRELGADRPGRMQMGVGARHAFANKADWHDEAGREEARKLAAFLNEKWEKKGFDKLLVIAPPKSLGEIRTHLDAKKFGENFRDIGKDLTHLSRHELMRYLEDHF